MPTSAELYAQAKAQEEKERTDHIIAIKAKEDRLMDEHLIRCDAIARDYPLNKNQLDLIHGKAWEDKHPYGYEEVEWEFRDLCSLVTNCLNAK